jgi:hypothetical protein
MNNEEIIRCINFWQNNEDYQPIYCPICLNKKLIPSIEKKQVLVKCKFCSYKQEIPEDIVESSVLLNTKFWQIIDDEGVKIELKISPITNKISCEREKGYVDMDTCLNCTLSELQTTRDGEYMQSLIQEVFGKKILKKAIKSSLYFLGREKMYQKILTNREIKKLEGSI